MRHWQVVLALKAVQRALRLGRECTLLLRNNLLPSNTASCLVNGRRVPRRFAVKDVEELGGGDEGLDDEGLDASPFPAGPLPLTNQPAAC